MSEKKKLIKSSEAIKEALMSNDLDVLRKFYMKNFQGFSIHGDLETLDLILEAYQSGSVKLKSYEIKKQQVELLGKVGIITGIGHVSGSYGKHNFSHNICFTDIYLKQDGIWKCYRSQATEIGSITFRQ